MKKYFTELLAKPKSIIPLSAVVVFVYALIAYRYIGIAPLIPSNLETANSAEIIAPNSNVSLSFAKSGHIDGVFVKEGDMVKKGQVIAKLYAPDAEGALAQAKGALDLALAQFASMNVQYGTTKSQQDVIVENAYRTLLSSSLEGIPSVQDPNIPIISGTYTCDKEGSYILKPYLSNDSDSEFSLNYSGLEVGTTAVKYDNSVPLGNCGLQIKFTHATNFSFLTVWTVNIPNTNSSVYLANKNAYDLAVQTREKVLADLITQVGNGTDDGQSVAKAQVDSARGAYEAAVGTYQNNLIVSPIDGIITFIDSSVKVGQSMIAGRPVISISVQ